MTGPGRRPGVDRVGQRLAAVAAAGAVALSYPVLAAADVDGRMVGIPVLYVYLFAVWAVLIGSLALVIERRR